MPSLDLMERAGTGLARVTAAARPAGPGPGGGGQGQQRRRRPGRGPAAARGGARGRRAGRSPIPASCGATPPANLERLPGEPPRPFSPEALEGSGCVVDAMLGTGFSGAPREPVAGAIAAINARDAPVVACDVPSGVDASTGEIEGEAVRAAATATFHGSKVGLHVAPGAFHAGRVEVVEIGIPRGAPSRLDRRPDRRAGARAVPAPAARGQQVRVGDRGGGGRRGAASPARPRWRRWRPSGRAPATCRSRCPEPAEPALDLRLLEAMTRGLPHEDGGHTPDGVEPLLEMAERAGAVVLGPGLGRTDAARGVRAPRRPRARRCRCWWTPTG